MQITKAGNKWQAWLSKLPSGPGTHVFDLTGLSKMDVEKIKDVILNSNNILKTGKQIQSKYNRYKTNSEIKEANLNEAPDNDMFKALNKVNNNIFKIMLKYEGKADINAVFSSWMLGLHAKLKKAGVTL